MKIFKTLLLATCALFIVNVELCASNGVLEKPSDLSVNFLLHPDMVLQNGYPVNIQLKKAISRNETFQFVKIAHQQPLLGWVVNSGLENTFQVAYQIIVASNLKNAKANIGDMWDTGMLESDQSVNIKYKGKDLQTNTVYFWKVKVWDNHQNESSFSEIQQFLTDGQLDKYPKTTTYPLQKTDVQAKKITSISQNRTLIDFGSANFGRLRINLFGDKNADSVIVRLGEKLKDNVIDQNPEGSIRYQAFKLKLRPGWFTYEVIIPQFYYNSKPDRIIRMPDYIGKVMPFRYCEIENYPGKLLLKDNIQQISVHYPFNDKASSFSSSDTILNAIWEMCKHTMKATSFCGIFVDGDRERFPREADSYINQLSFYGVERGISIARYTHEFQIGYASQWTEWLMHVVLMAWADYMETGDASSLEHFYDDLKAKTLVTLAREDGLISTQTGLVTWDVINAVHWQKAEWQRQKKEMPVFRDIVDWPQSGRLGLSGKKGETDNFEFKEINTVVNAFHYRTLVLMQQIASVLNKNEDAEFYQKQADLVKKSFNRILLDKKSGIYVDGEGSNHSSLHANMFAVAHGIVPEKNQAKLSDFIKSRGLVCSPYGALYLLESLYNLDEADVALDIITNQSDRGWARWIYEFGSTNTLESWGPEFKPNLDWNHPWGSAPASVIVRKIMGIEALEPGYRKIQIKPQPGGLESAEIELPTISGNIRVAFKNSHGNMFELEVTIPANTEANINLPKYMRSTKYLMNGNPVKVERNGDNAIIKDLPSGTYYFIAKVD